MTQAMKILLVEDDKDNCLVLKEILTKWGYAVKEVYSGEDAIRAGKSEAFDIVLTDIRMAQVDGLQVLKAFRQMRPEAQVITMTGFGSIDTAVDAVKAGAFDYISKPFKFDEIKLTLSRAVEQIAARGAAEQKPPETPVDKTMLIGHSRAMGDIYKTIARVAAGDSSVLIRGESGTGKELVARAVHAHSDRAAKPFVPVNCAALPEALLESELFGYARGAHSTATTDKPGMFEQATGGTLLLDEIGDMSLPLQAKLLRVLQDQQTRRLGDTKMIKTDVRVIASTNRDLEALARDEKFRSDLYYRLNVVTIDMPALRDRKEDIPALADHFIRKYAAMTHKNVRDAAPDVLERLMKHDWPGNVRELENLIQRAVILNTKSRIMMEDLPDTLRRAAPASASSAPAPATATLSLYDLEKDHILRVLKEQNGNIKAAAEVLKIDRKTLYRKLADYGVEPKRETQP